MGVGGRHGRALDRPRRDVGVEVSRGRTGLSLLIVALVAYGVVGLGILAFGPDTMAAQFGVDGSVTRVDDSATNLGFMTLVIVGLVALMEAMPMLARRGPTPLITVPNREAWNTPERRAHLSRVLREDLRLLTAGAVVLVTVMIVIGAIAGAGTTIPAGVPLLAVGAFLAVVVTVVVRMSTGGRYAPPAERDAESDM